MPDKAKFCKGSRQPSIFHREGISRSGEFGQMGLFLPLGKESQSDLFFGEFDPGLSSLTSD